MDLVTQLAAYNSDEQHVDAKIGEALKLVSEEEDGAVDDIAEYGEVKEEPTPKTIYWPEHYLDQFVPVLTSKDAMTYLGKRGIKPNHVKKEELLYDEKRKRIIFVLRDWEGRLVGCHSRTILAGQKPPYLAYKWDEKQPLNPFSEDGVWNGLPWLGENTADINKTLLVIEGPMDWLSVRRVYENAVCGLSVGLSVEKIKRLQYAVELITLFDVGPGGDTARARTGKYLKNIIHEIPPEEYGDLGAMPVGAIEFLLEDYIDFK